MFGSSSEVINNLVKSQQYLIDEIYLFQNQFKESLVNAATDITCLLYTSDAADD